ncbi:unnamed protein product [Musa acuminata subsp. burmannicoides]
MGWELVNRELPSLPPIRTSGIDANAREEDPSESTGNEEIVCCVTPKSEETVLKPALVCPPAPRKPRPPKRRYGSSPKGYFPVPDDLTLVFTPVSRLVIKKLRVD